MRNESMDPGGGFPEIREPLVDDEMAGLVLAYRKDPSGVWCPTCGPGHIESLAFLESQTDSEGHILINMPEEDCSVALYCHSCQKVIGIIPGSSGEEGEVSA